MGLTLQKTAQQCCIGVLGALDSQAESAELRDLIAQADPALLLRLEFYDADTLPAEVLDAIAQRCARTAPVKLISYRALLTHGLLRLDLPVQQTAAPLRRPRQGALRAVALAGSANSLDKILHIIDHLPLREVAVFIVQHVMEGADNLLDKLLRIHTRYQVLMPHHLVPATPGTIYVAPPGHHMKVAHGLVYLTRDKVVEYARPSIDVLFSSLAQEYGADTLAVLLCGYGRDGVAGCGELKAAGAIVLVEDGDDCGDARAMPDACRQAANYSHVLQLPAIASVVAAALQADPQAVVPGPALDLFLEALWEQFRVDFRGYQRPSLARRIGNILKQSGLPALFDFQCAVLADSSWLHSLVAEISVGVSGFFRHPEQFKLLREQVLPYLDSFPAIKLWSAGCATGEEPYSLAILLEELGLQNKSRLFATDFNAYLLAQAKNGRFPRKCLEAGRANYLHSGGPRTLDAFLAAGSHYLSVADRLRKATLFHRHSLVDEGIFNEFQLIMCRNVLIYFNADVQRKVLELFAHSLHRDGFLVLGPQDGIGQVARAAGFVPYAKSQHIYRLNDGGEHV